MRRDDGVRIDFVQPLGGDVCLVFAHRLLRGKKLAVQVGEGDRVVVHKVERANTAAHQRLGGIAAHAADAEDRHARAAQGLHGIAAEQQFGS